MLLIRLRSSRQFAHIIMANVLDHIMAAESAARYATESFRGVVEC